MDLEDRINEEMVVDTESMLEEHFDTAKKLFQIFEDGTVNISPDFKEQSWKEQVLIYLIGRYYAFEGGKVETQTLAYDFFYSRIDKDDSTIRKNITSLQDKGIVTKDDDSGEWMLVPESLSIALDRVEGVTA